ncbi:hypothetical protein [Endozoicomonas sp. SESOKO1]|uniref:hypothetical protein n=1 Tax=Endozoicomonas sp. SESOKO1 TaxID=2828742 RepID=UPI0021482EB8|nr:hypothetical protein [Endozoicomonas sp. SESOKO1]
MPSNVTANFSLFLLSNISTPAKGNSTSDNFVNGPVKKTASTGNDIVKTQKKFELRNTHKLLLKRKIEKKQPPDITNQQDTLIEKKVSPHAKWLKERSETTNIRQTEAPIYQQIISCPPYQREAVKIKEQKPGMLR